MTPSFRVGQSLRGQNGLYTIAKQVQETVWLAREGRNQPVIIKSVHHFRLQNERDVIKRFQHRTPFLRPLIDEIVEPSNPPAIVLKHLDDHLLNASVSQRLTSQEIKYVARSVLEALKVLHEDNFVHTDIKPDNILVNYGSGDMRFKDVQLADCGSTVPADSAYARDGDLIGAPVWRSPEAHLRIGWSTATDVWSFGAMLITLLYGGNFFLFKPDIPADHNEYEIKILQRQSLSSSNLYVTTRTSEWMRPDSAIDTIANAFTAAVNGYNGELPEDTKDVCARSDAQHTSTDPRDHFTGVCFNSKNEGTSVHFPVKK
ncbi:hypothetical protein BBP40_007922 [Aspergillus hancockii]|nr:hypothetical protein BBP40_007922 [Aspergillus hancockii]